jgi:hypothetical protein
LVGERAPEGRKAFIHTRFLSPLRGAKPSSATVPHAQGALASSEVTAAMPMLDPELRRRL